jgi:hypothetical protein
MTLVNYETNPSASEEVDIRVVDWFAMTFRKWHKFTSSHLH